MIKTKTFFETCFLEKRNISDWVLFSDCCLQFVASFLVAPFGSARPISWTSKQSVGLKMLTTTNCTNYCKCFKWSTTIRFWDEFNNPKHNLGDKLNSLAEAQIHLSNMVAEISKAPREVLVWGVVQAKMLDPGSMVSLKPVEGPKKTWKPMDMSRESNYSKQIGWKRGATDKCHHRKQCAWGRIYYKQKGSGQKASAASPSGPWAKEDSLSLAFCHLQRFGSWCLDCLTNHWKCLLIQGESGGIPVLPVLQGFLKVVLSETRYVAAGGAIKPDPPNLGNSKVLPRFRKEAFPRFRSSWWASWPGRPATATHRSKCCSGSFFRVPYPK